MRWSPARKKLISTNAVVVWQTVMLCRAIAGDSGRTQTQFTATGGCSR
jgi:hypothetical protein